MTALVLALVFAALALRVWASISISQAAAESPEFERALRNSARSVAMY